MVSRALRDSQLNSGVAEDGQLKPGTLIRPLIEAGRGADELLVDPLHISNGWIGNGNQVGRIGAVVAFEYVVILIALGWNPTRVADQAADLAGVELVRRAGGGDDVLLH